MMVCGVFFLSASPVDRVWFRRQPGLYLEPSDKRDCTEITRTHRYGRGFLFLLMEYPSCQLVRRA